jgi:hypothetical protein
MGNRGVLHDAEQRIVRDSQVRRWIACRLEFRGRRRQVMQPGRYTELFFLDEAAAFAAGHRPCAECRHADFVRFKAAWQLFQPADSTVDAIDRRLHAERRIGPWQKRTQSVDLADLPDGAYIALDGQAWLVLGHALRAWSTAAYGARRHRPRDSSITVTLLTPPSILAVIRAGYAPQLHPSAST